MEFGAVRPVLTAKNVVLTRSLASFAVAASDGFGRSVRSGVFYAGWSTLLIWQMTKDLNAHHYVT